MQSIPKLGSGALFRFHICLMLGLLGFLPLCAQPQKRGSTEFKAIQAEFEQARDREVQFYAPQTFQRAEELFETVRSERVSRRYYRSSHRHLREVSNLLKKAGKTAKRAKAILKDLIKEKSDIEKLGYHTLAAEEVAAAERYFNKAINSNERGDENDARAATEDAMQQYRLATVKWLNDFALKQANETLDSLRPTLPGNDYQRLKQELRYTKQEVDKKADQRFRIAEFRESILEKITDILDRFQEFIWIVPDTLLINDFVLIVDKITHVNGGIKVFENVSGTAWTRFKCGGLPFEIIPVFPEDYIFIDTSFRVVGEVINPLTEISSTDARIIEPAITIGEYLRVRLGVERLDSLGIVESMRDFLERYRRKRLGYFLVGFKDITIEEIYGRSNTGRIIDGDVFYPASPRIPDAIKLYVQGFTVVIDTLVITDTDVRANIDLQFPPSLASGKACLPAAVALGETIVSPDCEFYVEKTTDQFDPFWIGNTGMIVAGRGFIADFSSTHSYSGSSPPLPPDWKGVYLLEGYTIPENAGSVISNSGYLKADYAFMDAIVTKSGFTGTFTLNTAYTFNSLIPFGYEITFHDGFVNLVENEVADGLLNNCEFILPTDAVVDANGSEVTLFADSLTVQPDRDVLGVIGGGEELYWGELTRPTDKLYAYSINEFENGLFYLSSRYRQPFRHLIGIVLLNPTEPFVEDQGLQGAFVWNMDELTVYTPDTPNQQPLSFPITRRICGWLHVANQGVNGFIGLLDSSMSADMGPTHKSPGPYVGKVPLAVTFLLGSYGKHPSYYSNFIRFDNSAVYSSGFDGTINLGVPSNMDLPFRNMVFTSTAHNAGGRVVLSSPVTLEHWGLQMVGEPGYSSSGLVCVKTGQIILTAAGLSEPRHFEIPFYVKWGEMLASGDLARLIFDFNTAGQLFDGFNFAPSAIRLSEYDTTITDQDAYLQVGGTVHFDYFGPGSLNILDYKDSRVDDLYNGRLIKLSFDSDQDFQPSDTVITGGWSGDFGDLYFEIMYDSADQDGFTGSGTVEIDFIEGKMNASIVLSRDRICMSVKSQRTHDFTLGPVANFSRMNDVWACGCIEDGQLRRFVLGARLEASANANVLLRSAAYGELTMLITPSLVDITINGDFYVAAFCVADLEVNGRMHLRNDLSAGSVEGDIYGLFKASSIGNGISAEGQADWHFGPGYSSIQGRLSITIVTFGSFGGVEGGFYYGNNAPRNRAWILEGENPKFRVNKNAFPDPLTGIYAYFDIHKGINLYVISGGIDLYAGYGAFLVQPSSSGTYGIVDMSGFSGFALPHVVGHLGFHIYGDILGGLASAGAWANLLLAGPPLAFQGDVGLEACVAWVICGSVGITVGLNPEGGFYVE